MVTVRLLQPGEHTLLDRALPDVFDGPPVAALCREFAAELGCTEAWTATEPGNARAQALYRRLGGVADPTPFVMFTFAVTPCDG